MGRCKEWAKVVGDDKVDARVLAMRHKDQTYVPKLQKATKPERVMTYRSNFGSALGICQCILMSLSGCHFCFCTMMSEGVGNHLPCMVQNFHEEVPSC